MYRYINVNLEFILNEYITIAFIFTLVSVPVVCNINYSDKKGKGEAPDTVFTYIISRSLLTLRAVLHRSYHCLTLRVFALETGPERQPINLNIRWYVDLSKQKCCGMVKC